ncbi:MAG: hypothetical protein JXR60_09625 [Bacteroidales bacterium]|nr:hypothetical protein [Bacteroidales bacterium]
MNQWSKSFERDLEMQLEDISHLQINHLNTRLFNKTAQQIDYFSKHCATCEALKNDYEHYVDLLSSMSKDEAAKKGYEQLLEKAVHHLTNVHQIKTHHYFRSLYALVGLLTGVVIASVFDWYLNREWPSFFLIYGAFIGSIAGRIVGYYKDKSLKKKNQIL